MVFGPRDERGLAAWAVACRVGHLDVCCVVFGAFADALGELAAFGRAVAFSAGVWLEASTAEFARLPGGVEGEVFTVSFGGQCSLHALLGAVLLSWVVWQVWVVASGAGFCFCVGCVRWSVASFFHRSLFRLV